MKNYSNTSLLGRYPELKDGRRTIFNPWPRLALLNEDDFLAPGSHGYQVACKMISEKIDRLGPERTLVQVIDTKAHLLNPIRHYVIQPVVKN